MQQLKMLLSEDGDKRGVAGRKRREPPAYTDGQEIIDVIYIRQKD